MPRAIDLIKQGRNEDLWQMCCGFLKLNLNEFMDIQNHLLLEQLELLNNSTLGLKIMRGVRPQSIEEFRERVPLTTYKDYCPELLEKRESGLPVKPFQWVRSSGKSGEYTCKWVPMTTAYVEELSKVLYGVGILAYCKDWGEVDEKLSFNVLYSVAPRPYISGTFAEVLKLQTNINYLPPTEKSENTAFEDRIKLGFAQAMSRGMDYFFGISLVLVKVGEQVKNSSKNFNIKPFLGHPRALFRLAKGMVKSRVAGREAMPKDFWSLKGIISSGVDSWVYKEKIKELWGKMPLDLYSCTEGSVIATQAWNYDGMTFIPQLNFLEFIPESELIKLQMDKSYTAKTLLLSEVKQGEKYEIVITNFHGGVLTRYRMGDMIKIQSLTDEKLGIKIPQMVFERRVDDIIDFAFVRLTEKAMWQVLEKTGVPYEDWVAYKERGEAVLRLLIETKAGNTISEKDMSALVHELVTKSESDESKAESPLREDFASSLAFKTKVTFLPRGTFARYMAAKQSEGADLAHLKPPHVNPPEKVLSQLLNRAEETIIVTKIKSEEKKKTGRPRVNAA